MSLSIDAAPILAPFLSRQLGPERSQLVTTLRERLHAAGLRWPEWLDARPGLLTCLVGDCDDGLLPGVREHLAQSQPRLLLDGLSALSLAVAAPKTTLAMVTSSKTAAAALRSALPAPARPKDPPAVEVILQPSFFPTQPEQSVEKTDKAGRTWVVPAEELARAGAAVHGQTAPSLCAVVGAVKTPTVVEVSALPEAERTPRALVARAGGAEAAGWVALVGGPLPADVVDADAPLSPPPDACAQTLTILPAAHALVRRYRARALPRVRTACLSCRACTDACPEAPRAVAPHEIMAAIARKKPKLARLVPAALGCTGCGACTLACPADLLPSRVLLGLKTEAPPERLHADPYEDPLPAADRRLPRSLALSRLGLAAYCHTLGT